MQAAADKGIGTEMPVQSKNVDVQGQIADVGHVINDGVIAGIIKMNAPAAFCLTFAMATAAGIALLSACRDLTSIRTQDGMAEGAWGAIDGAGTAAAMPATADLRNSFVK